MKTIIEPKFSINDLVANKWATDSIIRNQLSQIPRFYEVAEIKSVTCSAGTQVYYCLRAYEISKSPSYGEDKGKFLIGPMHMNPEYCSMREDELVPFDITPYQV